MGDLRPLAGREPTSNPYTVSQLTGHIRRLLDEDPTLEGIWVEGEVSNFSRATSGHCYFTMKDAGAQLGRGVRMRSFIGQALDKAQRPAAGKDGGLMHAARTIQFGDERMAGLVVRVKWPGTHSAGAERAHP